MTPDDLRLMVVTDRRTARGDLPSVVAAALVGGATAVQLREKDLGARELLDLARSLRRLTADRDRLLVVNDRVDVALLAGADGVHLGWRSLPPERVREIAGDRLLVGVSTHDEDEAVRAAEAGADYVVYGPVFPTPSKEGILEPRGPAALADVARAVAPVPVVAIGGLDATNAGAARRAGAAGVAVIRAVLAADDPTAAAQDLVRIVRGAIREDERA